MSVEVVTSSCDACGSAVEFDAVDAPAPDEDVICSACWHADQLSMTGDWFSM